MAADHSVRTSAASGLTRLSVAAPGRRLDLTVPSNLPVADLLPELIRHAGDDLSDTGERHGGWLLRRADGTPVGLAQSLYAQGLHDGAALVLVAAAESWPQAEFDDVVEAIADGGRRYGQPWSPSATRTAALAGAGVLLAVPLLTLVRQGAGHPSAGGAALVLALGLLLAGIVASRAFGDARLGTALGTFALPYALVGGALAVTSDNAVGLLPGLGWCGAPQLLTGAVAMTVAAAVALLGVGPQRAVFTAGFTAGLLAAAGALGGYLGAAGSAAAVLLTLLVCGIGVLPLLAIRWGRLPMPPLVVAGAEAAVPGAGEVGDAVVRSSRVLTGLLAGHAVAVGGAVLVLAVAGDGYGLVLAVLSGLALLLRSRLFLAVQQRVSLLVAGLAAVLAVGVVLAVGAAGGFALLLVAGGAVVAVTTALAGMAYAERPLSPYLGRLADVLDTAVVLSVVPVACAVLGLYARVRDLVG